MSEERTDTARREPSIGGGRTLTTDDVITIMAVGACIVALMVCVVAHYLAASV